MNKTKQPLTNLTPAQRAELILKPRRNYVSNFTLNKSPSKPIHVASTRFATA